MSKVTTAICKEAVNVAMETTLQACGFKIQILVESELNYLNTI